MKKKKRTSVSRTNIRIGDIKDVSGNINVAGGDITMHQSSTRLSASELRHLFDQLYLEIDAHSKTSPANKEDIKADVKEIQVNVTKAQKNNNRIDESFLSRRFRNIARVAPDILDVIVATLVNPLGGLGVAVKKIADKAKEETK